MNYQHEEQEFFLKYRYTWRRKTKPNNPHSSYKIGTPIPTPGVSAKISLYFHFPIWSKKNSFRTRLLCRIQCLRHLYFPFISTSATSWISQCNFFFKKMVLHSKMDGKILISLLFNSPHTHTSKHFIKYLLLQNRHALLTYPRWMYRTLVGSVRHFDSRWTSV